MVGSRFIKINATSSGTTEYKKLFQDATNELSLTGRRTIIFYDEIHRFTKAQQDVFLKPVEASTITLIGATTENPSFKIQATLLSRYRTFTLQKLSNEHVRDILTRALKHTFQDDPSKLPPLVDDELLAYLSTFTDSDARTALNLLELAISLTTKPPANPSSPLTKEDIKAALTKTLVYRMRIFAPKKSDAAPNFLTKRCYSQSERLIPNCCTTQPSVYFAALTQDPYRFRSS
jgi:putative ATPase